MTKPTTASGVTTPGTAAEQLWRDRVRDWRRSGKTAQQFAEGTDFAAATLRYWSSRLLRAEKTRFVQLVPSRVVAASTESELVLEVGAARIRVRSGFAPKLLADVVRALSGGAQ